MFLIYYFLFGIVWMSIVMLLRQSLIKYAKKIDNDAILKTLGPEPPPLKLLIEFIVWPLSVAIFFIVFIFTTVNLMS